MPTSNVASKTFLNTLSPFAAIPNTSFFTVLLTFLAAFFTVAFPISTTLSPSFNKPEALSKYFNPFATSPTNGTTAMKLIKAVPISPLANDITPFIASATSPITSNQPIISNSICNLFKNLSKSLTKSILFFSA